MKQILLLTILIFLLASCVDPPRYDDIPAIKNLEVNKTTLDINVDSLVIKLDFEDGDGDIGTKEGESEISMYRIDTRNGFVYPEYIPFVNLKGSSNDISGTIWLTLRPGQINCRPDHLVSDTLTYEIYIVDRAKNKSNVLETPQLILTGCF